MTTAGADHSQIRSVGGRRPAATSRRSTSSIAMCSAGSCGPSRTSCQSWSRQSLARRTARRTATATALGEIPAGTASPPGAARMLAVIAAVSALTGSPVTAAPIRSSTPPGPGKKSSLTRTRARRPPATSTSAATSSPPGGLYSPCMLHPRWPFRQCASPLGAGAPDPHPPRPRAGLNIVPGELAAVLSLELVPQRQRVVVAGQHEPAPGPQRPVGGEDRVMTLPVRQLPYVQVWLLAAAVLAVRSGTASLAGPEGVAVSGRPIRTRHACGPACR